MNRYHHLATFATIVAIALSTWLIALPGSGGGGDFLTSEFDVARLELGIQETITRDFLHNETGSTQNVAVGITSMMTPLYKGLEVEEAVINDCPAGTSLTIDCENDLVEGYHDLFREYGEEFEIDLPAGNSLEIVTNRPLNTVTIKQTSGTGSSTLIRKIFDQFPIDLTLFYSNILEHEEVTDYGFRGEQEGASSSLETNITGNSGPPKCLIYPVVGGFTDPSDYELTREQMEIAKSTAEDVARRLGILLWDIEVRDIRYNRRISDAESTSIIISVQIESTSRPRDIVIVPAFSIGAFMVAAGLGGGTIPESAIDVVFLVDPPVDGFWLRQRDFFGAGHIPTRILTLPGLRRPAESIFVEAANDILPNSPWNQHANSYISNYGYEAYDFDNPLHPKNPQYVQPETEVFYHPRRYPEGSPFAPQIMSAREDGAEHETWDHRLWAADNISAETQHEITQIVRLHIPNIILRRCRRDLTGGGPTPEPTTTPPGNGGGGGPGGAVTGGDATGPITLQNCIADGVPDECHYDFECGPNRVCKTTTCTCVDECPNPGQASCETALDCGPRYDCNANCCQPHCEPLNLFCTDSSDCSGTDFCFDGCCVGEDECGNGVLEPGEACETLSDCGPGYDACWECKCEGIGVPVQFE